MAKCSICGNKAEYEYCSNCIRKFNSSSYVLEYCSNCNKEICFIQQKVDKHKYIEYKGKCPYCGFSERSDKNF